MTSLTKKIIIAFFILFGISSMLFFDVVRIDMEDHSQEFPAYISGEPADDMPTIVERLRTVEHAACSSSKNGEKIVRKHAIGMLKKRTDNMGGNGVIDVTTGYGKHPDLSDKCAFGVYVSGTAVVFSK
ncbi:MAG TPA: heavy metal-binding domain-containing protein [Gammaproteobacteria bacterium]|jgi:uncharacterized protein YbjQ (UPF0145 family)|nr:heavy metal-binding domain-containing protein [Gammaproteobacteria bacterium]